MRLNIGAGANIFPYNGWINYDRADMTNYFNYLRGQPDQTGMPEAQQRVSTWLRGGGTLDYRVHDLRAGFPQHPAGSVDAIYVGQMIEHINPLHEAPAFVGECWRMLRKGGVLRMTTPDLDLLIDAYRAGEMLKFASEQPAFYAKASPSAQLAYIMYGSAGPACTWSNYEGHMFLYTWVSIVDLLRGSGFTRTNAGRSLVSADPVMDAQVVDEGMSHSFVVEAIK